MGKRVDRIAELEYTIEALEDELEHWEAEVARWKNVAVEKQARLVELLTENDRLTLAYEPFIPEEDEDHGLSFYGLKEDNDILTQKLLNFMEIIREQEKLLKTQDEELFDLEKRFAAKKKYFGSLTFDFWPPKDFLRLSLDKWSPGRAFQLCVGPIRFEWAET